MIIWKDYSELEEEYDISEELGDMENSEIVQDTDAIETLTPSFMIASTFNKGPENF